MTQMQKFDNLQPDLVKQLSTSLMFYYLGINFSALHKLNHSSEAASVSWSMFLTSGTV
jgi:hypothetical protein